MKYDIEIALPVNHTGKYARRILDFRYCGLQNIGNRKVRVVLLGSKAWPQILSGWPKGVDVEQVVYPFQHVVPKLCHYYLHNIGKEARWYAVVDDDSVTDIDGMVTKLDQACNHKEVPVIFATQRELIVNPACDHFNELGFLRNLGFTLPNCYHHHESVWAARSGIFRVLEHPQARYYITKRADAHIGYGDVFLGFASVIAGVSYFNCDWSSHQPLINEFSLFGGRYNHIHFISTDNNTIGPFLKLLEIKDDSDRDSPLWAEVVNKEYDFSRYEDRQHLARFKLEGNGLIAGSRHPNESYWRARNDKLYFLDHCGEPSTIFSRISDGNFAGNYLFGTCTHLLLEVR
jgi:hypothetical protein